MNRVIVVLGPTASGKSELAVRLARKFNGEVISADSRQVYRGLDIGSGKVSLDRTGNKESGIRGGFFHQEVRHHLIDVASPRGQFTAADYRRLGRKALHDIFRRGNIPIVCGGTGFYINALLYDFPLPAVAPQPELRTLLEARATADLFSELQRLDPARAARIDRYNRRRLVRALEIVHVTGAPIPPLPNIWISDIQILKIGVRRTPEELAERIRIRLLQRLRRGMVREVARLHKSGVSWKRMEELGLEYRYISRFLRGILTKNETIELLEKEICRYAKRQMTWFRRDNEIHWVRDAREAIVLMQDFLRKLNN